MIQVLIFGTLQQNTTVQTLTPEQLAQQPLLQQRQISSAVNAAKSAVLAASTSTGSISILSHSFIKFSACVKNSFVKAPNFLHIFLMLLVSLGIPIANAVAANSPVIQTVTSSPASATPSSQSIVIASAQQISSVVPTASITTLSPGLRQTRPMATIPVGIQVRVVLILLTYLFSQLCISQK